MYNKIFHSYVPRFLLKGEIRPILKNEKTSKTDSDNYRPIMNFLSLLKFLEYLTLSSLNRNLSVSARQFGFRQNTKCQSAFLSVQEMMHSHTREKF